MELEITHLAESYAPEFSGSAAELGDNAGQITWANNIESVNLVRRPLLDTDEKKEAFRDFVKDSGGWTREEIDEWSDTELNALCHQWIMGDVRECPAVLPGITFREDAPGVWYHENEATPDMETGPFDSRSDAYRDACSNPPEQAGSLDKIDWPETEAQSEQGHISGRLFCNGQQGDERRYYFCISN
jgi:hypothetical protein